MDMAMINCPECGAEISDKAKKCIHCGKVLIEEIVPKRFCVECGKEVPADSTECPYCGCPIEEKANNDNVPQQKSSKKLKKIIIPVVIVAIIAIVAFTITNFIKNNLNEDEQLAYQNATKMKSMMKDPDSFKLYDEMFLLKHHDDDGNVNYTYTIFKYGGANGYGAITTDEAIFKDGDYIMDYADEPDEDDSNYLSELEVKLDLAFYMMSGSDSETWDMVDIDIEKIKNKMGLE
jgi:hypothetical protein